jgi:hypothetical protein
MSLADIFLGLSVEGGSIVCSFSVISDPLLTNDSP